MVLCRDVTEMTTEYLEGTLPLHRRVAMRFHLSICSMCRRYMRQVRQTIGLLGILPPEPVPEAVENRLVAEAMAPPEQSHPPG